MGQFTADLRPARGPAWPGAAPAAGAGDVAILLLLPFLEIGRSYWLSGATLAAVLVLWRVRPALAPGWRRAWPWAAIVPGLFLPLVLEGGPDPVQDALRIAREALIFVALLAITRGLPARPLPIDRPRALAVLTAITAGLLLLTAVQAIALRSGHYLGFPAGAYAQGQDTIPDALDLRWSHLRPAATFSEPSYLGFVMLSVALAARGAGHRRLLGLAIACGLVAQAASFVLSIALVGTVAAWRRLAPGGRAGLVAALLAIALALLLGGGEAGVLGRLAAGRTAGGDFSVFVRLFGPAEVLPGFLADHPFGLPFGRLPDALAPLTRPLGIRPDDFLQNGFYNLLFEFGLPGLGVAAALLAVRDGAVRAYLGCCMAFNGGFLAVDKLAVIGVTLLLVYGRPQR